MKTMYSLSQLATMLDSNAQAMADYIVPMGMVKMGDDAKLEVSGVPSEPRELTPIGHGQLGETLSIPKPYYDLMRASDPALLATNVNRRISTKPNERKLVRSLRGEYRAFLSDRYQRIDNKEVAEVTLNVLAGIPGVQVRSSAITESRLYIRAVTHEITATVKGSRQVGDVIAAGVHISNSEVGMGSVSIKPFIERLVCINGMVRDDGKLRANHVGRRADESIEGLLSDSTRRLEDEVVLRKVRDVLRHAFDATKLQQFADKLSATTQQVIEGDVNGAIEVLGPTFGLQVSEKSSVLRHLISGGDISRWGLANAITRTAEDVDSFDRAVELETIGYKLIDLGGDQWNRISRAQPLKIAA
ncbi:MAG: DUF932 domain-containing protein [Opitutaceae bacterium]|nr:DUF932 domain-containing protein [Opitutaceae bacterium]